MKKILVLIFVMVTISCEKLNISGMAYRYSVAYRNTTKHKIEVVSYPRYKQEGGPQGKFILEANSDLVPFNYYSYPKLSSRSSGVYLGFVIFNRFKTNTADSVVVTFDDSIKITHDVYKIVKNKKNISFEDQTNILNGDLYKVLVACQTKHDEEFKYAYYFGEEDYLYAKNHK